MSVLKTILAGVAGTTLMTAFSYVVSNVRNKQFREPELLNKLSNRVEKRFHMNHNDAEGWLMHYGVGLFFSSVYDQLWRKTGIRPSVIQSILLGATTGVAGTAIWELTFRMHPNPPKIDFKEYYIQLLAAHAVFGLFAALAYRIPEYAGNRKLSASEPGKRRQDAVITSLTA